MFQSKTYPNLRHHYNLFDNEYYKLVLMKKMLLIFKIFGILDCFSIFFLNQFSYYYYIYLILSLLFGIYSYLQIKLKILRDLFLPYILVKFNILLIINLIHLYDQNIISVKNNNLLVSFTNYLFFFIDITYCVFLLRKL